MSAAASIARRVRLTQLRAAVAVTTCTVVVGALVGAVTSLRADDAVSFAIARTMGSEIRNHATLASAALDEVVQHELSEQSWFGRPTTVWRGTHAMGSAGSLAPGVPDATDGCRFRWQERRAWRICSIHVTPELQVTVASPVLPVLAGVLRVVGSTAAAGFLTLLLFATVSHRLVRRALSPLEELGRRVDRLSRQPSRSQLALDQRWQVTEVDALAEAFDGLLARMELALQHERRFLADASHELRTPLTQLHAQLELVTAAAAAGSELQARLRKALTSSEQLVRIAESVLTLARSEVPAGETVNVRDALQEWVKALALRDGPAVERLRIEGPDEALVRADPTLIALAMGNLVENALKFSPGLIQVTVSTGTRVQVAVDDAGPGIPDDQRARMLEPFVRGAFTGAHGAIRGVGLGLALTHHVARAYAGTLTLGRSAAGGLKATLSLPPWSPTGVPFS